MLNFLKKFFGIKKRDKVGFETYRLIRITKNSL
jgi:hypothetical protein